MSRRLRVGHIDFANCTPLFLALEALGTRDVEYRRGVPTELNTALHAAEVDLSPSSSVEYLRHPEHFGYLPDLSISSVDRVGSVLLFSQCPLKELNGRSVGLSPASATSVALLRVLLESFEGVDPIYGEPGPESSAILWIGDRALRERRDGSWPHVYDLGELWFRRTQTPFVFALWICRRDVFESAPNEVRKFYRALIRARHLAYRSYESYARRTPEASWMGVEGLLDYWQTISYDLTAWHREGLRLFAEAASALGLLREVPPLDPLPVETRSA